jgi:hypothetical protein
MKTTIITALVFGLQLFAQTGDKRPTEVTSTERVDFAPGGVIHLTTASSNLFVEAWDRPEVEIRTIKSSRRAQCLDDIRVATTHPSATELAITTTLPPSNFFARLFGLTCGARVEQHVNAPGDSRLVIRHGAGYLMVSRMSADIEASSRSGDIVLMLPDPGPYAIDAKSTFGGVSSDFAGTAHRKKLLGEAFAGANPPSSRRIYLRIGFGGITIKEVPPNPEAPAAAQ